VIARHLEENISGEQVQWVLAPVLAKIRTGAFDRPKRPMTDIR
jgi:hypothetical protein